MQTRPMKTSMVIVTALCSLVSSSNGQDDSAATIPVLLTLRGHDDLVETVSFSPDGKMLASGSRDHTVKLWRVESGELVRTLTGHIDTVVSLAFSPDGKLLASCGRYDRTVRVWNADTGGLSHVLKGHGSYIEVVAWSPDGKTLASGSSEIYLWDRDSWKIRKQLPRRVQMDGALVWSPDSKKIAFGGDEEPPIYIVDATSGEMIQTLQGHRGHLHRLAWSPDGKTLASGGDGAMLRLFDLASGTMRKFDRRSPRSFLAWSPSGTVLIAGNSLWDSVTGKLMGKLDSQVRAGAWSADGKMLATASRDEIVIWDGTKLK